MEGYIVWKKGDNAGYQRFFLLKRIIKKFVFVIDSTTAVVVVVEKYENFPSYSILYVNPFQQNQDSQQPSVRGLLEIWENEKMLVPALSHFPTMIAILSKTNIISFHFFCLAKT